MGKDNIELLHDECLTMGIGTSIIFDMSEADAVFRKVTAEHGRARGEEAYRAYMMERIDEPLDCGPGFEFVQSFLEYPHHELVVCSRNSALTALRAMRTFYKHNVIPECLFFTNGTSLAKYMEAYGVDFFLSTNERDVKETNDAGTPAALFKHKAKEVDVDAVLEAMAKRNVSSLQPRAANDMAPAIAAGSKARRDFRAVKNKLVYVYDYDKVLVGPESEDFFIENGLDAYQKAEAAMQHTPMEEGPFFHLYQKQIGLNRRAPMGLEPYRVSIVTARGGLASFRALNQLAHWGLEPNGEVHFRSGASKQPILEIMREEAPLGSIFFDDGEKNIKAAEAAKMFAGHVVMSAPEPE
ncbi:MAG: 5'-nucleotidase [Alphaproteobacteria bacterium]|nr:5'-nucleotidase [Alphaproteobacteria bacterium]